MDPDTRFEKAIEKLYAASTGDERWETALDHVLNATGFEGAALYVYDRRLASMDDASITLVKGLWHRLRTDSQQEYENHYFKLDPRMKLVMEQPGTRILYDYLHTPEEQMDRSEYYAWYQKSQGTRYYIGGQTSPGKPFWCGFTMHRNKAAGHASESEIARFNGLFDHLERAIAVDHRLNLSTVPHRLVGELVEANSTATLLMDARGEVVFCNSAARRIVASNDAFALQQKCLRALRASDNDRLCKALRDAIGGGQNAAKGMFRVARRSGRRDYLVIVSPVARDSSLFSEWVPAACVLVCDPDEARKLPQETMRRIYGLTTAELRLCACLAAGATVEEAALQLGVAAATVRFHIAAIFRKTDTKRQSELLKLLLCLPSGD